jgi:hypothetical protein
MNQKIKHQDLNSIPNDDLTHEILGAINFHDPSLVKKIYLITSMIALVIAMLFGVILELDGYSSLWILIPAILLIPVTIAHEYIHYPFQWLFSHKKPYVKLNWPISLKKPYFSTKFPFCALSKGSSIAKKEAIISALAPCFILIILLVIPTFFIPFLPKILFLAFILMEIDSCYGDFYLAYNLSKYSSDIRLKNVNEINVFFRIIK